MEHLHVGEVHSVKMAAAVQYMKQRENKWKPITSFCQLGI